MGKDGRGGDGGRGWGVGGGGQALTSRPKLQ